MEEILNLLDGFTIAEKRSSLYYLGRYLKQAESFIDYQKDIFEDDEESEPSEEVKNLTINLINVIEKITEKKASEFSDFEYLQWMERIAEIEDNLDPKPNEDQIKTAMKNLEGFDVPKLSNDF